MANVRLTYLYHAIDLRHYFRIKCKYAANKFKQKQSKMRHRYYFTLTRSNQCTTVSVESEGDAERVSTTISIESETTFEGVVNYEEDAETGCDFIEVQAYMTGFTQYKDGKVYAQATGLKLPADRFVTDLEQFERECVERAFYEAELRITKQAA